MQNSDKLSVVLMFCRCAPNRLLWCGMNQIVASVTRQLTDAIRDHHPKQISCKQHRNNSYHPSDSHQTSDRHVEIPMHTSLNQKFEREIDCLPQVLDE